VNRVRNFGAIGAVVGHEIMHAFDDEGKKFDKDGNLQDWWTAKDSQRYELQVKKAIDQYDNYQVMGHNISGAMTAGIFPTI
jgi:putative endopeptidase